MVIVLFVVAIFIAYFRAVFLGFASVECTIFFKTLTPSHYKLQEY